MNVSIAIIQSALIPKLNEAGTEHGVYEHEVFADLSLAKGDPKGYAIHEVSVALAGCVKATGFPLGNKMWNVAFSDWAQVNLGLPKGFTA